MEDALIVRPAFGHQIMEVGVKVDLVSERLNDGNDTGLERLPRPGPKIEKNRPDGTAAKLPQEPAFELEEDFSINSHYRSRYLP